MFLEAEIACGKVYSWIFCTVWSDRKNRKWRVEIAEDFQAHVCLSTLKWENDPIRDEPNSSTDTQRINPHVGKWKVPWKAHSGLFSFFLFSFYFFFSLNLIFLCKNHTDFRFKASMGTIFLASGKVFPEGAIINSIWNLPRSIFLPTLSLK